MQKLTGRTINAGLAHKLCKRASTVCAVILVSMGACASKSTRVADGPDSLRKPQQAQKQPSQSTTPKQQEQKQTDDAKKSQETNNNTQQQINDEQQQEEKSPEVVKEVVKENLVETTKSEDENKKPNPDVPRQRQKTRIDGVEAAPEAEKYLKLNKVRLAESRTVRVFISSTFRDFALERDYLMRHALPELRKFGESRGVTVVFVDLRWGVTSEESSGGAVVRLCLQEIDACRPFFVGLLGERYGWHLPPAGADYVDNLLEQTMDIGEARYPWVAEYRDRSVTELEMLHGALLRPDLAESVTFYFRQHEAFKQNMAQDIHPDDLPAYEAENDYARKGQNRLKDEVRERFPDRSFDYDRVSDLSKKLVEDVARAIELEFPMDKEALNTWDFIDLQHEAFAASKRMGYVPAENSFQELDAAAVSSGPGLAIVGPSGMGKSALLANWVFKQRDKSTKSVFVHYIGCTTESTSHYHIIRRVLAFFGRRFDLDIRDYCQELKAKIRDTNTDEVKHGFRPDDVLQLNEQQLIEVLPDFLVSVVSKASEVKIQPVVVLDGLDQLEDKAHSRTLFWMPPIQGISLIASFKQAQLGLEHMQTARTARSRGALEAASRASSTFNDKPDAMPTTRRFSNSGSEEVVSFHWMEREGRCVSITDLDIDQRRRVVVDYLAEHAKKLDETQIKMVLDAPPAHNPLFLRTLLDEARLFGNFFQLTAHLETLLKAETNPELFGIVLDRMGAECGQEQMQWAIGLVLCARDGITDQELREVLAIDFGPILRKAGVTAIDIAPLSLDFHIDDDSKVRKFVQLLFSMREQLCSTSGLLRFFHDAAKEAVRNQLGGFPDKIRQVLHWRLSVFFGREDVGANSFSRQIRELPYHLLRAERHDELANYASQIDVLRDMLQDESKKYELVIYWRDIDTTWSTRTGVAAPVSVESFLCESARDSKKEVPKELHKITKADLDELRPKIEQATEIMDYVSTLLVLLGMYDGAVEIRQDEIAYNTVLYGAVHDKIAISCSELADVYERVYCKYDVSMKLKSRAVDIDRQLYGEDNLQLAVGYDNLGFLHLKLGNFAEAESMYRKSLTIKESVSGKAHRDVAQTANALGLLSEELGNLDAARRWYERSLDIRTRAFGPNHPSVARSQIDMGMLLLKRNDPEAALGLVMQGYTALSETLGHAHSDVAAASNNLGLVYSQLKEFDTALTFHMLAKASQVRRLGEDHPAYAATCTNIGSVCQELADQAFRKDDEAGEEDNFLKAEDHYSRAVLIYRVKMGDQHPELATTLHNLGTLYFDAASREITRIDDVADEDIEQVREKIEEFMSQACKNFKEALEIRVRVFGLERASTQSTKESLRICTAKLERFKESGGTDMKFMGTDADDDEGDGGPDLVDLCAEDIEQLRPIIQAAFMAKFGVEDQEVANPSDELDAVLDRVAQELSVEPFLPRDLQSVDAPEMLTASLITEIVQKIIRKVYANTD